MIRFMLENNTDLTKEELVAAMLKYLNIDEKRSDIRVIYRYDSNKVSVSIGRNRGIKNDIFIDGTIDNVKKAHMEFETFTADDVPPITEDNQVVDRDGNVVVYSAG